MILEQILENTKNYLYENEIEEERKKNQKKFLAYCQKHNLEVQFEKLYSQDKVWQDLAKNEVFYFIDYKQEDKQVDVTEEPEIQLMIWSNSIKPTPVIKLLVGLNDCL